MRPEDVIARVLGVSPSLLSDESSNRNLPAWDSLAHVNLIMELESVFRVSLTPEEALAMTDVGTIKRILRGHGVGC